jgi:hypothetical protein
MLLINYYLVLIFYKIEDTGKILLGFTKPLLLLTKYPDCSMGVD